MGGVVKWVKDGSLEKTSMVGSEEELLDLAAHLAAFGPVTNVVYFDNWFGSDDKKLHVEEYNLLGKYYKSPYKVDSAKLTEFGDRMRTMMDASGYAPELSIDVNLPDDVRKLLEAKSDGPLTVRITPSGYGVGFRLDDKILGRVEVAGSYLEIEPMLWSYADGAYDTLSQLIVDSGIALARKHGGELSDDYVLDFTPHANADTTVVEERPAGSVEYPAGKIPHKWVEVDCFENGVVKTHRLDDLLGSATRKKYSDNVWELSRHLMHLSEMYTLCGVTQTRHSRGDALVDKLKSVGVPFYSRIHSKEKMPEDMLLSAYHSAKSLLGSNRIMPFSIDVSRARTDQSGSSVFNHAKGLRGMLGSRFEGCVSAGDERIDIEFHSTEGDKYILSIRSDSQVDVRFDSMSLVFRDGFNMAYDYRQALFQAAVSAVNHMAETIDQWGENIYGVEPAKLHIRKHHLGVDVAFIPQESSDVELLTEPVAESATKSVTALVANNAEDSRIVALKKKLDEIDFAVYGDAEKHRLALHIDSVSDVLRNVDKITSEQKQRVDKLVDKIDRRLDSMLVVAEDESHRFEVSLRVLEAEYDDEPSL